jgi:hypothetical protein
VADDPYFLAAALAAYQRGVQADDHALAVKLGCGGDTLTRLRLCRMPAAAAPDFWRDIQLIAQRFSLDADALAEVVRLGQSVVQLQAASPTNESAGFLMAARDDESDGPPTAPDEEEP